MNRNECQVNGCAVSFTGWQGLGEAFDTWQVRLAEYRKRAENICGIAPGFVVFGSSSCERMILSADINELMHKMDWVCKQKSEIVFELPPIHQKYRVSLLEFTEKIMSRFDIAAMIVNDIGGAILIRNSFPDLKLQAGRAFDKTVRENRFDIRTIPEIKNNYGMLERIPLADSAWQNILKRLGIGRAVVDTLPDGKLLLPECEIQWDVIYPGIRISKMAKCEYDEKCDKGCRIYCKQYKSHEGRILIRQENEVICFQQKKLEDSVCGRFRLIYSCP